MLTRVQLNLLGRRSYLSSVISLATGTAQATISLENNDDDGSEPYGNDFETNRRYLTFSWWLLNEGWKELGQRVEAAVRQVFGHLSPRDLLSFEQFSELTLAVRKIVEGETPEERRKAKWLPYLLPPRDREDHVLHESGILEESTVMLSESATFPQSPSSSPAVRRLLDETSDLIESPSFTHVLTLLLNAGFSTLVDKKLASAAFDKPDLAQSEPRASQVVLLPKILSVLTRQAHVIGNDMPNQYLQEMEQVRDLEGFAAVVYSSNWENEIQQEEGGIMASTVDVRASDVLSGPSQVTTNIPSQTQETTQGTGDESVVVVDPASSFESAWGRAQKQ